MEAGLGNESCLPSVRAKRTLKGAKQSKDPMSTHATCSHTQDNVNGTNNGEEMKRRTRARDKTVNGTKGEPGHTAIQHPLSGIHL
jgi:hypothetical protein